MEYWDIYDQHQKRTGKKVLKGTRLQNGEYHFIVHVWLRNCERKYLIEERSSKTSYPYFWCTPCGNVMADETPLEACIREVKEEIGIDLSDKKEIPFDCSLYEEDGQSYWCQTYLYEIDIDLSKVKLQEEEVSNVRYATIEEIKNMMEHHKFFIYTYLDRL